MQYDKEVLSIRETTTTFEVKQSIDVNALFMSHILQYLTDDSSLLDIGNGNGFVLSKVLEETDRHAQLFGVDNSHEMVLLAQKNLTSKARITEASSDNLPFDDCNFDIATAKNVTRINAAEIFRVLKDDGVFIFREYGFGKGVLEIARMFEGRIIRQRKPDFYVEKLSSAGFQIVSLDQYEIRRSYDSAEQLVSIVKSFPFIEDFSEFDEATILKKFAKNATITSDPFILVAIKKKGCE
jgi:ubiquinone/menaquinone biosynthesis C-methylase UbiE